MATGTISLRELLDEIEAELVEAIRIENEAIEAAIADGEFEEWVDIEEFHEWLDSIEPTLGELEARDMTDYGFGHNA